jgi:polyisoprenoid-binding protein YceI
MLMIRRHQRPPTTKRVGGRVPFAVALMCVVAGCDRKPVEPPRVSAPAAAASERVLRFAVKPRAETPLLAFTFPEPLNDYKGEAKTVSGAFTIAESMAASSLRGFVEVETASVTLGEPEIDANAHSAMFMNVEKYPVSRFEITGIDAGQGVSLLTTEKADIRMRGDFSLKGHTVPIVVPTTLTVRRAEFGGVGAIMLSATWEINILKPFEIPGPSTGEAAERVVFRAELELVPEPESGPAR